MFSSGIFFLLLSATSTSFLQIALRVAQKSGRNVMAAIAANYLVATIVCYAAVLISGNMKVSMFTLYFGILMGIIYLAGLVVIAVSFGQKGVALTSSIVQLAILIPTLMSIFIWAERTSAVQTVGILLAAVSLPLLTMKESGAVDISRNVLLTTIALFFVNGFAMSSGKILLETGHSDQQIEFYLILYATAFLASIPFVIKNGRRPSSIDLSYGSIVGGLNAITNLSLTTALTTLPGSIAFPLYSATGLLITVAVSIVLLREKINRINAIGIATCLAAVILINA